MFGMCDNIQNESKYNTRKRLNVPPNVLFYTKQHLDLFPLRTKINRNPPFHRAVTCS